MSSYILRLGQQLMAFLTIQITIFLYDKETYIIFNNIMLVYLVMLAFLQPILQNIWNSKEDLFKDMLVICCMALLVSWLLSPFVLITTIFVVSRCVERYFYILSLNKEKFETVQIKVLILYIFEFSVVVLASFLDKNIDYRVLVGAFSFFLSIFIYRNGKGLYYKGTYVKIGEYSKNLIVALPVIIYFLFSTLLINIDRKYLNFEVNINVSLLLAMNVLNVLFSLVSVKIDKLRVSFKKNIYPDIELKYIFFVYFLFCFGYYFTFMFMQDIHLLGDIEVFYYISYTFLNLVLIMYMMFSTYFLQKDEYNYVILFLTLALCIKLILLAAIDLLYITNIVSGMILLLGLFFLRKGYYEKKS